jgi:hypothetical protein
MTAALASIGRIRKDLVATIARARAAVLAARAWERGQRSLLDAVAPDWLEHTPDAYVIGARGEESWTRTLVARDWPPQVDALDPSRFGRACWLTLDGERVGLLYDQAVGRAA